ncbi:hypothetical protein [Aquimarina pacifica]|uniref:hypothetical protein n=1 Tax=Aquimarina pacifica TaxID=1296415 RepID=UPI0004700876|nr:hypothetical protein [Aquimarina pacifica]
MKYFGVRYLYIVVVVLLLVQTGRAQNYQGGYSAGAVATPTAAQATRASSATVDLTTGAAQYSVPVYTINQDGVSWGVGLQYRYSGLKVLEEPSPIGLGWGLAGTGMVSREVRGLPDDHPYGYHGSENVRGTILDPYYFFDANNSADTNGKQVLKEYDAYRLANGILDGEPDVFTVSAGRLNFSFKLGLDGEPVLMSHHNIKLSFDWDHIEVIDSEGVTYVFTAKETFAPQREAEMGCVLGWGILMPTYTRSWYLTAIQPKNTTRQITFEYATHQQTTRAFVPKMYSCKSTQSEFIDDLGEIIVDEETEESSFELFDHSDPYVYSHVNLEVAVEVPVLERINFAEGSLLFNTHTVPSGAYHQYSGIELLDFHEQLIHHYDFTTAGNRRLLTHVYKDDEFAVRFDYYGQEETDGIPAYEYNQQEVAARMDAWGYYKGSEEESANQITSDAATLGSFVGTRSGALQTIGYKTGGTTELYYEQNTTPENTSYGGIRVHRVQNCPGNEEECTQKRYEYTHDDLTSSGVAMVWDSYQAQASIFYEQVSQYSAAIDEEGSLIKNGKTVYTFVNPDTFRDITFSESLSEANLPPVAIVEGGIKMKSVRTYKSDYKTIPANDVLISEQFYEYEKVPQAVDAQGNSQEANYPYGLKVRSAEGVKRYWHLDREVTHQMERNGYVNPTIDYTLVNFNNIYINGTQADMEAYAPLLLGAAQIPNNSILWNNLMKFTYGVGETGNDFSQQENAFYKISTYKTMNVLPRQKRVISRTYSDLNPNVYSESIQEFTYDHYNQVTTQTATDSKGITKKSRYYYPYDPEINNTTLINQYRIASPVKTETYSDAQKQGTALVNFDSWEYGHYLPSVIQASKEGSPLRDQTIYHKYDNNANPLEVSQGKSTVHTVYIWGYNDLYPIAKIGNATYDQVAGYVANLKDLSNDDSDRTQDASGQEGALRAGLAALRAALPDALVTTYTYDPLIGITSTTDPRGYTAYYEYDPKGRLLQTRDDEQNIIDRYYYDYAKTEVAQGYSPLTTSVTTFPSYGVATETANFVAAVSGGSDNLSYKWEIELPNKTIQTYNGRSISVLFTAAHVGVLTIRFITTDNETGNQKSSTQTLKVHGAYNVSPSYPSTTTVNNTATFTMNASGGSGYFKYTWKISGRSGYYNRTSKSFTLNMGFNYYGTNRTLICTATDTVTGRTFTFNKKFTVNGAQLGQSWTKTSDTSTNYWRNEKYTVTPTLGSGSYSYKWTGDNGSWTGATYGVYQSTCRDQQTIKCVVTDKITGLKHTKSKSFYFNPSWCSGIVDPTDPTNPVH